MVEVYPVKFGPIFKERIWGGQRLGEKFGKKLPPGKLIGESWELADLPEDKSQIENGPLKGVNCREFLEKYGEKWGFSKGQCGYPFGLLIKFLDANDVLSVQVHPDSEACKLFPGAQLKTECWYVLEAEPEAVIYRGLKPGVGRTELAEALKEGRVEELMAVYKVKKGDFHFLPAGTVHALGAGVIVAEIQTPSDTTYRLYDWNRKDSEGKSRKLHVAEALASVHYTNKGQDPPTEIMGPWSGEKLRQMGEQIGEAETLVDCSYFSVVKVKGEVGLYMFAAEKPFVMIALGCKGVLTCNTACEYSVGDTVLCGAAKGINMDIQESGEFLLVCLGNDH